VPTQGLLIQLVDSYVPADVFFDPGKVLGTDVKTFGPYGGECVGVSGPPVLCGGELDQRLVLLVGKNDRFWPAMGTEHDRLRVTALPTKPGELS
jgi:hypothetical protein